MRELHDKGEYKYEWISNISNGLNKLKLNDLWNIQPE